MKYLKKLNRHRKIENWEFELKFYSWNPFKIESDKKGRQKLKKSFWKFKHTKKSNIDNRLQFYERNSYKNEGHKNIKFY